jgi:hypothetical protein
VARTVMSDRERTADLAKTVLEEAHRRDH